MTDLWSQYTYSKKGRSRRLSQNKCVAILVSTLADNTRAVLISKKARDWGTAEVVLWHTQPCPGKSTLHSLMLVKACLGGIPHKRIKCERHSGSPAASPGSSCFYFPTCLVSLWCPKFAVIDLTWDMLFLITCFFFFHNKMALFLNQAVSNIRWTVRSPLSLKNRETYENVKGSKFLERSGRVRANTEEEHVPWRGEMKT